MLSITVVARLWPHICWPIFVRSCIILLCKLSDFKIVFTELIGFGFFFYCFLGDFWWFFVLFCLFYFLIQKMNLERYLPSSSCNTNRHRLKYSYFMQLYVLAVLFLFLWTALAKIQTNYRHLKYEYYILVTFEMLLSFQNFMEIFPRQAEQISLMSFCIRNSRQLWK